MRPPWVVGQRRLAHRRPPRERRTPAAHARRVAEPAALARDAGPQLKALTEPLESCESTLWLLAHPESRHLRRIAAVYQHLADAVRLPGR